MDGIEIIDTYKGKGYASLLLAECLKDAKTVNTQGVAVVTRKGAFMLGKDLFVKHGFEVVDTAPPDFKLLVKKFYKKAPTPKFNGDLGKKTKSIWHRLNDNQSRSMSLHGKEC